MSVEIETEQQGETTIMSLSGGLDLPGSVKAAGELAQIEQREPALLVIDLRGLEFIDSSGIELIVAADKQAKHSGRRLAVVRGPEQVHRVFTMMSLEEELELVEDPARLS